MSSEDLVAASPESRVQSAGSRLCQAVGGPLPFGVSCGCVTKPVGGPEGLRRTDICPHGSGGWKSPVEGPRGPAPSEVPAGPSGLFQPLLAPSSPWRPWCVATLLPSASIFTWPCSPCLSLCLLRGTPCIGFRAPQPGMMSPGDPSLYLQKPCSQISHIVMFWVDIDLGDTPEPTHMPGLPVPASACLGHLHSRTPPPRHACRGPGVLRERSQAPPLVPWEVPAHSRPQHRATQGRGTDHICPRGLSVRPREVGPEPSE